MKSSNEEPSPILLSKRNARSLLVQNAIDAATLEQEARLLQSERKSEERLFRKKKELILQRHSRIFERQKSSVSLPEKQSNPSPSKEELSSLRRSCSLTTLPKINAGQRKLERHFKKHSGKRWQVSYTEKNGEGFSTETCPIEEWTELRKCRYLRSCSRNNEVIDVEQLSEQLSFNDEFSANHWQSYLKKWGRYQMMNLLQSLA